MSSLRRILVLCLIFSRSYSAKVPPTCFLKPDHGYCSGEIKFWYYSPPLGKCMPFVYYGCGGNANRFANETECEEVCKFGAKRSSTTVPPIPPSCLEDRKPAKCSANQIVWYFDRKRGQCEMYALGSTVRGCEGSPNSFATKAECADTCLVSSPRA